MQLSKACFDQMTSEQIDELLFDESHETPHKADYALLLGTEPTYAVSRAEITASYYAKGGTAHIIATGAAVHDTTGTESAIMCRRLLERGVPADAVTEEPNARDTVGNMICSLGVMYARGDIAKVKSVAVITEPFHMRRSIALARLFLPSYIQVFGYTEHTAEQRRAWRDSERLARCVRTEVEVLSSLARMGWIEDETL